MADGDLGKLIQKYISGPMWQRIETGGTGRGIPDINGCLDGIEVWVENKATDGWTAGLRPEQVGWIDRRARAGGRVFVLVRRTTVAGPRRGDAVDDLYLYAGRDVLALAREGMGRTGPEPLHWSTGGPGRWDWAAVREWLFGVGACTDRRT